MNNFSSRGTQSSVKPHLSYGINIWTFSPLYYLCNPYACGKLLTLSHLFFADDLVLFSEASMHQLRVILDCMNRFCGCSRQRVNFQISQIFFSTNVENQLADKLSTFSSILHSDNLVYTWAFRLYMVEFILMISKIS